MSLAQSKRHENKPRKTVLTTLNRRLYQINESIEGSIRDIEWFGRNNDSISPKNIGNHRRFVQLIKESLPELYAERKQLMRQIKKEESRGKITNEI